MPTLTPHHPSSYRDPSGFVFLKDSIVYRQVNNIFKEEFDYFNTSGCYKSLTDKQLLIPHEIVQENGLAGDNAYLVLKPEQIAFISYAWEWSFDMLKDAALTTLRILREALNYGLILKDASPYNIQWRDGKPVFIDTLSFERYNEQEPWIAYRQYCESFLSPLLLMHYRKISLTPLLLAYPEGIPLSVTKSLLPWKSKFSLHTWLHIHLHAKISLKKDVQSAQPGPFSKKKLLNLITSLELLTRKLTLGKQVTVWSEYYDEASRRDAYLQPKLDLIAQWVTGISGIKTGVDLGANEGMFSSMLAGKGVKTVAVDFDSTAINQLYSSIKKTGEKNILPLIIDLANPSPATGLNNTERARFSDRIHVDLGMALAVVHHLAISKNIPFLRIAEFFEELSEYLIIEFIPKDDDKVKEMLAAKKDIYHDYTEANFEKAFARYFTIQHKQQIANSGRLLYLMKRNG